MTIIEKIATHNVNLVTHMGAKGKKADEITLGIWHGAWAALDAAGDTENAQWVYRVTIMLISTRGYSEAKRIVANIGKKKED